MPNRFQRRYENRLPFAALLCSLILMPLCAGFEAAERPVKQTLVLGQPFYLSVEEDHSTEYRWNPVYDKRFFRLKRDRFTPDKSTKEASDGTGTRTIGQRVFVFVPVRTGRTRIALDYRHPDEDSPADTRKVEVTIVPRNRAPARGARGHRRGRSARPFIFSN